HIKIYTYQLITIFEEYVKYEYHIIKTAKMLREERQSYILNQVTLHNKVRTTDICAALNVSLDTVRRDLTELEKEGKLEKVHGGAISTSFHYPFQQLEVYARDKKQAIAQKALHLIKDGMVVLFGGGTVMLELARVIPENLRGTIFTVSPLVALEIAQRSTVEVLLIAGRLARNSYICTGSSVVRQLSEIQADLCFLGTNGLTLKEGITDHDWEVVQVKKSMIQSAKKTAILTISEKLDTVHKLQVCNLNSIDYLITELPVEDETVKKYEGMCETL
ncbi:MAG: DeoR/GlpR family DNA-binding transcription regulator, partial [Sphingobacteriaceae bacterium]